MNLYGLTTSHQKMQNDDFQPDYDDQEQLRTTEDEKEENKPMLRPAEPPLATPSRHHGSTTRRRERRTPRRNYRSRDHPIRFKYIVREFLCDSYHCLYSVSECPRIHMHIPDLWKCLIEVDTYGSSNWLETLLTDAHDRNFVSAPLYAKFKRWVHAHHLCFKER